MLDYNIQATAVMMEADGNISLVLLDGTVIPASPENLERAESLWLRVDSEVDLKMDQELFDDAMKLRKQRQRLRPRLTKLNSNALLRLRLTRL